MSLNLSKLENTVTKKTDEGTVTIARCPACAAAGGDNKGEHLFVYPTGQYACIRYPGEAGEEHRKEIFRIAGADSQRQRGPTPIVIKRPKSAGNQSRTIRTIQFQSLVFKIAEENKSKQKEVVKLSSETSDEAAWACAIDFLTRCIPLIDERERRESLKEPYEAEFEPIHEAPDDVNARFAENSPGNVLEQALINEPSAKRRRKSNTEGPSVFEASDDWIEANKARHENGN